MERIINSVKPSKSKPQQFTDSSDVAKSFYSQEERSVEHKRKERSKALGQTDEDNPNAQAKIQYRHSKFGHSQKKEEKEFKVIERPQVVLASQSQSKTLQTLQKRHNAVMKHPYIHLMFSPSKRVSVFKKHLTMMFRGLTYSIKYLKGPSEKFIKSKEVVLNKPENSKGKALMLDLDETLIHSCGARQKAQFIIKTGSQSQGVSSLIRQKQTCDLTAYSSWSRCRSSSTCTSSQPALPTTPSPSSNSSTAAAPGPPSTPSSPGPTAWKPRTASSSRTSGSSPTTT